jgi:hypothetical protein
MAAGPRNIASARIAQKTPLPQFFYSCFRVCCGDQVTATELCLATGVFAEPIPINCCLCWLHNYGFQQTRQNNLGHHIMLNRLSNIHFSLFKLLVGYPFFFIQIARHSETSKIKRDLKKTQNYLK